MEASQADQGINCRTLWISDIHLGCIHCKAEQLLSLLQRVNCEKLYLVGDIVDLWAMSRRVHWPEAHNQVLRQLLKMSRRGVKIVYIPGNHDSSLREFCGNAFGHVEIRKQAVHRTADGRTFLITHGDEFDYAVRYSRLNRFIGDKLYQLMMTVNRWVNALREKMGKPYWSLAKWIKKNVSQAEQAIRAYQEAAIHYARDQGYNGIICGHLHHPVILYRGDVEYCNDGDWVESCSALLEDFQGQLHLIRALQPEQAGQAGAEALYVTG